MREKKGGKCFFKKNLQLWLKLKSKKINVFAPPREASVKGGGTGQPKRRRGPQQGGFSAPVGPDEANPLPSLHLPRRVLQHLLSAVVQHCGRSGGAGGQTQNRRRAGNADGGTRKPGRSLLKSSGNNWNVTE